MKAVIIAGGRGKRLKPLTNKLPKPVIPVNGKPVLEHQINLLKRHGIDEIIVCGGYMIKKIKEYFKDGSNWSVKIIYSKEDSPLGTGGAIKNARHLIGEDDFVVLMGDIISTVNFSDVIEFHKTKKSLITMILHKTEHPIDSDVVDIDNSGKVVKFIGKGQKEKILGNTGMFVFSNRALDYIPLQFSILEKDIIANILDTDCIHGYITTAYTLDIGTPERLQKANEDLAKGHCITD